MRNSTQTSSEDSSPKVRTALTQMQFAPVINKNEKSKDHCSSTED